MKKIAVLLTLSFILGISCPAAPCYGPKMPDAGQWFAGTQTHVVFDRDLEENWGSLRSRQHFLLLSYGVFDWLSLDLKGGAGNVKQHPQGAVERDYPSAFAGGYGLRIKLYEGDDLGLVFGFQHISVHPHSIRLEGEKNRAILDDWQVSLLAGYGLKVVNPYLGLKWSRMDYIHWQDQRRKRRMSDLTEDVGLFAGFDVPCGERIWFNLEGQFLDGQAASFSVNYSF